jgi:regulatory protein
MDDDLYQQLLNAVFRLLSIRPRSIKEIRDYLIKKTEHTHEDTVDRVIIRLTELGYADDLKFAQWLISQRQGHKPKGNRFVENELKTKGVAPEIITQVIEDETEISQKDLARTAVAKKLTLWSKLPVLERKNKIYGFLGRQGFDSDTIRTVIDEATQKDYNNGEE